MHPRCVDNVKNYAGGIVSSPAFLRAAICKVVSMRDSQHYSVRSVVKSCKRRALKAV